MADLEDHAPRPLALICGTLASKDTAGFLAPLQGAGAGGARRADRRRARRPAGRGGRGDRPERRPRSRRLRQRRLGARQFLAAREWPTPPRILIAGSLYLAGAVLRSQRRRAALTCSCAQPRRQLSPLVASFALAVVRPCRRSTAAIELRVLGRVGRHIGLGAGLLVVAVLQMAGERGLALAVDLALEVVGNALRAP